MYEVFYHWGLLGDSHLSNKCASLSTQSVLLCIGPSYLIDLMFIEPVGLGQSIYLVDTQLKMLGCQPKSW